MNTDEHRCKANEQAVGSSLWECQSLVSKQTLNLVASDNSSIVRYGYYQASKPPSAQLGLHSALAGQPYNHQLQSRRIEF
jgi:hypothetical protein